MNNIILFLGFLLIPLFSYSQFTWQELEPNNQESIGILYVKPNGEILGYLEHPAQLLLSKDKGISWDIISEEFRLNEVLSFYNLVVETDKEGDYYFGLGEEILKLNMSNGALDNWLTIDFGFSYNLQDFDFLPDGNLVIGSSRNILLYDVQGNLLRSKEWWSHSVQFLIGDGNDHFVLHSIGATDYVERFTSDLSELTEDKNQPSPRSDYSIFEEGRIFSDNAYSDDGINWFYYPNNLSGVITYLSDGSLHLIDGEDIYLSSDRGQTFNKIGEIVPSFFGSYSNFSRPFEDGSLLIFKDKTCFNEHFYLIEDGQAELTLINNSFGSTINSNVEAFDENNVFTGCDGYMEFIHSGHQTWQHLNIDLQNFDCYDLNSLITTPNGNIVSSQGCVSSDQGQTWTSNLSLINTYNNLISLKDDVCYVIDYGATFFSTDNGESWTKIDHQNGPNFSNPLAFSSTEFMYTLETYSNSILKRKLDGELDISIAPPMLGGNWISFETAYKGPNIYGIYEPWNGPSLLVYSYDGGYTVSNYEMDEISSAEFKGLKTDHLGNVFLYTDKGLWISQDGAQTWQEITPQLDKYYQITDIDIGWDSHIYMATRGYGILRSSEPLKAPVSLNVLLFKDLNNNCSYDNGEPGLDNVSLHIGNNIIKNTDDDGYIRTILVPGMYNTFAKLRSDLYRFCNTSYDLRLVDQDIDLNIPVQVIEECASVTIGASTPLLRRCFDNTYHIEIHNEGSDSARNIKITLKLDEYFDYNSSEMELISNLGNIYTFEVEDLAPRDKKRYKLEFNLSCEAEIGQQHYLEADLFYNNPCDIESRFNTKFECRQNIGSYDPNDKAIFVGGFADKEIIGEHDRIEYLIRFQNTGTDTAFTVRIEDQLHEAFDRNNIHPISASHDYSWDVRGNRLNVHFDNILLVDSFQNEKASHGFINFAIDMKEDRPEPGSIIHNNARIYFDFNEPIVTNTVESYYLCKDSDSSIEAFICPGESLIWDANDKEYTEAGSYSVQLQSFHGCDSLVTLQLEILDEDDVECIDTSIDDIIQEDNLYLYPNPAKDQIKISHIGIARPISYTIRDLSSKLIKTGSFSQELSVNLSEINAGLYIISIRLEDMREVNRKFIITD